MDFDNLKKGAISFEVVIVVIIVLVFLLIVLAFYTGQFDKLSNIFRSLGGEAGRGVNESIKHLNF